MSCQSEQKLPCMYSKGSTGGLGLEEEVRRRMCEAALGSVPRTAAAGEKNGFLFTVGIAECLPRRHRALGSVPSTTDPGAEGCRPVIPALESPRQRIRSQGRL